MLSLLEHQVYVLPDRPLIDRIPAERWDEIVAVIVKRVTVGDVVGGLCHGIEQCGLVLAEYYPARLGDNPNELPDTPIQGSEENRPASNERDDSCHSGQARNAMSPTRRSAARLAPCGLDSHAVDDRCDIAGEIGRVRIPRQVAL